MPNLLLLIFPLEHWLVRSWSLGGWELHDFRRTGVFIDLSCCFDIIFTLLLRQNFVFILYQSCIFVTFFFLHGRMSVRVSPLTLMIPFPLYYLNFLPTVSVSSKQRRPDLDLCLFIPKSPFASNSDPNTTILFFFHSIYYCFIPYHFLFFFTPYFPSTLSFSHQ